MSSPKLSLLLGRLADVVREEVRKDFIPNCCIASSAILRRVFRHFHFEAYPIVCSVIIRNRQFYEAVDAGEIVPARGPELTKWMDARGAYALGIVPESATGPDSFGGHLVLQVQDVIVDASLDLADRPQWNIVLPKFIAFKSSPSFTNYTHELAGRINGVEIIYRRIVDNSYRFAPDWVNEPRARRAVNDIIFRVERKQQNDIRVTPASSGTSPANAASAS